MKLAHIKALVTGAAGGIGATVAQALIDQGAGVLLTDRREDALERTAESKRKRSLRVDSIAADITSAQGVTSLADRACRTGVNTLINLAGICPFGFLSDEDPARVDLAMAINTTAPIQLSRRLLPYFSTLPQAHIVNVGSMLGSIAMPGYCAYGASKAALHCFSEGLRRELSDSNVRIHYIAPRATRTPLNERRVCEMNEQLGVKTDAPEVVANAIVRAIATGRSETFIGYPERIYRVINAVFPAIVDNAVSKQLAIIRRFAQPHSVANDAEIDAPAALNR